MNFVRLNFENKKFESIVNPRTGIIKRIYKTTNYNDEPKLFNYTAELCNTKIFSEVNVDKYSSGCSLNQEEAIKKAFGEAIERYCLAVYKEDDFIKATYDKMGDRAIDLYSIVNFSENQLNSEFKDNRYDFLKYNKFTEFNWVKGYSLIQQKEIYIPAQLVYVPYNYNNEKLINFPISTGAALGTSLSFALYRGICEIIERDAFMIFYLNKLVPKVIDLKSIDDPTISKLAEITCRYNLELFCYDITTDLKIPVAFSVIIDRSGVGPAVSCGINSDVNWKKAIEGSIYESIHSRPWMREIITKTKHIPTLKDKIITIEERGLLWYNPDMIDHLNFLFKSKKMMKVDGKSKEKSLSGKLSKVLKTLIDKHLNTYFVDITTPDAKDFGFRVVKVVIPELQPLYLDERFRYLGGNRLYKVPSYLGYPEKKEEDLNRIPHPFL